MTNIRAGKRNDVAAELAVQHIITSRGVTYRQAATRYNVPINAIRARINYRWGSLAEARKTEAKRQMAALPQKKLWARPCMTCGADTPRPRGQYRCDACHEKEDRINEVAV